MKPNFARLQQVIGLLLLCVSLTVQAQMKVGQPAGSPDPSSALDVSGGPYSSGSQFRGIAPPKVVLANTSSAAPVDRPVTGLLIYNTATVGDVSPGYYYWGGSKWLRFTTASAGTARVAAVNGQDIPAYLISEVASLSAPDIIYIADPGREGVFRYVSNSTLTVDGTMVLAAVSGQYLRIIPDGRITPQMFGAIPDDGNDDGAALSAWFEYSGSYEHYLPAGTYRSNIALVRTDKKGFTLKGAGQGKSIIQFTDDTHGLCVKNISNQAYGQITMGDFEIRSTGAKSVGKDAIYINSDQGQNPGPKVANVSIQVSGSSENQWTNCLHFHNTSYESTTFLTVRGIDISRSIGILISVDETHPSVVHNITDATIENVRQGVVLQCPPTGNRTIEGVQLTNANIVGAFQGVYAVTAKTNRSPYLGFTNCHINTGQGEAIYVDGFTQVVFTRSNFYANTYLGVVPPRCVYLANTAFVSGDFQMHISGATPIGAELAGLGTITDVLSIGGDRQGAATVFVQQGASFHGIVNASSTWSGNDTISGSIVSPNLVRLGGVSTRSYMQGVAEFGVDQAVPSWNLDKFIFESVRPHVANTSREYFVNSGVTNATVSMADYDLVSVINGSSPVTITIDRSGARTGQKITVKRYDATSTGTIIVQSDDPIPYRFQSLAGDNIGSITLPQGMRPVTWMFNSSIFELTAGAPEPTVDIPAPSGSVSGDLLYYNGTTWIRLPKGSNGQRLELVAGIPTWVTPQLENEFFYASTNITITPTAKHTYVRCSSSTAITVTVNIAGMTAGNTIAVFRDDVGATGTISVATSTPGTNLVQETDGNLNNIVGIPATPSSRQKVWVSNGAHLNIISN